MRPDGDPTFIVFLEAHLTVGIVKIRGLGAINEV
jgi:hypothetical protein